MPPLRGLDSSSMADSQPPEYPREMVDLSQQVLSVRPLFDNEKERKSENEDVEVAMAAEAVLETNKRKRYSMQKLKASCELFLKPNKMMDLQMTFPETFKTMEIEGQITKCPGKKRNYYRVQWSTDTQGVDPAWLRTTLDNTAGKKQLLQVAIEKRERACQRPAMSPCGSTGLTATAATEAPVSNTPPAAHISVQAVANLRTSSSTIGTRQSHRLPRVSYTPPAHIWVPAVANLRTLASTIGSLCSQSQSVLSTTGEQAVRTSTSDEAEESESENEEDHELEEEPEDLLLGDRNLPTWEDDVSDISGSHGSK